jgi:hypothetical protein
MLAIDRMAVTTSCYELEFSQVRSDQDLLGLPGYLNPALFLALGLSPETCSYQLENAELHADCTSFVNHYRSALHRAYTSYYSSRNSILRVCP